MNGNPLDPIKKSDIALFDQIEDARELAFKDGEISKKNKFLIALAIDAAKHSHGGIRSLATQALENGATKNEIMETLRVANFICGVGSIYAAAEALKDIL
jgi:alkylhydroperoxidase/carboxymuconolactone decarboxylase family protein YurZ